MWNVWYVFIAVVVLILVAIIWSAVDECAVAPMPILAIGIALVTVLTIILIANPILAKQNIKEFEYTKEMVIESVSAGTDLQNAAVTSSIIEMNQWLSETKAQRDVLGNWSVYSLPSIAKEFDVLTPITASSERDGG